MNKIENQKCLKDCLYDRIEDEAVCPRPRLFFHSRECLVWFLWLISVLIGSIAVAVSLFVVMHRQYDFYEATHDNFLTFLVDYLPYLWFFVFIAMIGVAIYNLRHTARGYRYSLGTILLSSLVLSFAGGSALQLFGVGYKIDDILGNHMNNYLSQEKIEKNMWQSPTEGRLLGRQSYSTVQPTTTIIFKDTTGRGWTLDVRELNDKEKRILASGQEVKILGKCLDEDRGSFYACGVFPVMMDKDMPMKDRSHEREIFIERLYEYKNRVKTAIYATTTEFDKADKVINERHCEDMKPVLKMP
ncbi:hypothetical protein KC851_01830 [Candidatus Kaiserbacteria bacterium]|nr:hypothetical protein [Candidatus Kaiserbacteria bacterium]